MSLTPEEEAMEDRLDQYNAENWNAASNPYGLDGGGSQTQGLFVRLLRDFTGYGQGVRRVVGELLASTTAAANKLFADTKALADQAVADARDAARLAAEDAANTEADRIATAKDVVTSAGHVGAAGREVRRAAGEADRAIEQGNVRVQRAAEWATRAPGEPVSAAAGGDGATTFSARHWAAQARADAGSVNGPAIAARIDAVEATARQNATRAAAYSLAFGGF